ncbi:MAG TPA: hypothetical protein VK723_04180 [Thermoplasmata archaeon]|nr:hypothetical protein [Thermoplasmata archaeon]
MGLTEPARGSGDGGVARFDHWVYGVIPGTGYTSKAFSKGLDAGLYDPYLRGHYTPIRAAAAQTIDADIDLRMIHPIRTGREILVSRVTRGPLDEAGRPTFTNHTMVATTELFRMGRVSLDAAFGALEEFEKRDPDAQGEMSLLDVPMRPETEGRPHFGSGIHRHLTFPALETLATRIMTDANSRTLMLCRNTTPEARNATLNLTYELLTWGCGLPPPTAISDAPRASALNYFNFVISPRGVRSDSTWAILESALAESVLPRAAERDEVYQVLMAAMRQSPDLPLAR